MLDYVVTGALITPVSEDNVHPFQELVSAPSREAALKQVHDRLSTRLDPEGTGSGDIYNFYVDTAGHP